MLKLSGCGTSDLQREKTTAMIKKKTKALLWIALQVPFLTHCHMATPLYALTSSLNSITQTSPSTPRILQI